MSRKQQYTCFIYGEGRNDKNFLVKLIELEKFKYHTKKWRFEYGNASGQSPKDILTRCRRAIMGKPFDLVECFIDLDTLKHDYPKKWKKEKAKLEKEFSEISIIWQYDNLEDEYKGVLRESSNYGKNKLNIAARKLIKRFINSTYWDRILEPIHSKEKELDEKI